MTGARHILAANLRKLMSKHPVLRDRKAIAARTGISARTVGYMLQSGEGNPTLANIEAVADAFKVPAWRLLTDDENVDKLLLLDKILSPRGVDVGDAWDATKANGAPSVADPGIEPYRVKRKPKKGSS